MLCAARPQPFLQTLRYDVRLVVPASQLAQMYTSSMSTCSSSIPTHAGWNQLSQLSVSASLPQDLLIAPSPLLLAGTHVSQPTIVPPSSSLAPWQTQYTSLSSDGDLSFFSFFVLFFLSSSALAASSRSAFSCSVSDFHHADVLEPFVRGLAHDAARDPSPYPDRCARASSSPPSLALPPCLVTF